MHDTRGAEGGGGRVKEAAHESRERLGTLEHRCGEQHGHRATAGLVLCWVAFCAISLASTS